MNFKKSVAILGTRGIPAQYGGFETFAQNISVELARKGYDVVVYCPKYRFNGQHEFNGVRLIFISNFEYLFKNRVLRAICNVLYDIFSLLHSCAILKFPCIYMLGYSVGPFLFIPRFFGKRLVVNPDGLEWKSTRWGRVARAWLFFSEYVSARAANFLVADAPPISERFVRLYRAKVRTIEYGSTLYVDDAENLEIARHSYYLVVARMVPETKVDLIISGFVRAALPDKRLIVVGPIADDDFFNDNVVPLLNPGKIDYLGSIYDERRLRKLRANASALIHGHASDGTNPSLLESMGSVSPVIAIDRPSNVAVLTRENGIYFDSEESLAAALVFFEGLDFDRKSAIARKNFERVRDFYSWERCVEAHEEVFASIGAIRLN